MSASRDDASLRFWAFGREGEVVQELVRDFVREYPGQAIRVQQMPWSAAHEKLLTAIVGRATPDMAQMGNTWIPEMVTLGALAPVGARLSDSSYFPGIVATNVVADTLFGVPWYVDTRVLFWDGSVTTTSLGVRVELNKPMALARRLALSDAREKGTVTINGDKYVVVGRPDDDGRVWMTLHLHGPLTA